MADNNELVTITRAELRAILQEASRGVADEHEGTPYLIPHRGATGRDAEIYAKAAREAFENVRRDVERDLRDMVREATKEFLPGAAIRQNIEKAFEDIGLPIDTPESRRKTAAIMGNLTKWQGRIDKVLGGAALAILSAALYAIAKLIGINLPNGSGGHS